VAKEKILKALPIKLLALLGVHPLFSAVKKDFKDYGTADGRRCTQRKAEKLKAKD
jgi:hypothetical protein